jgi:hypothetical protein
MFFIVILALALHAAAGDALIEGGLDDGAQRFLRFVLVGFLDQLDAIFEVTVERVAAVVPATVVVIVIISLAIHVSLHQCFT